MDFINERAAARYKFNFFLSFTLASAFMVAADFIMMVYDYAVFSLVPRTEWSVNLVELSSFIFITLIVVIWTRKVEKASWKSIGFTRKKAGLNFLLGWGIGGGILIFCVLVMMALGAVEITGINFSGGLLLRFIPIVIVWSIQGNAEEVLARGWLFTAVSSKHNILLGIIVSSVFFTVLHLGNDGIAVLPLLDLALFGIFAALLMLKTKNIWVISGFHASWNCFQGSVFAFPVSGHAAGDAFITVKSKGAEWLSGGSFGVEGSLVSILTQLVIILWLSYDLFIKQKIQLVRKQEVGY